MPKCQKAKIQKCKNAAKTQKYNNAKLKIVSNVVRGPSCLSFPKSLGAVPLDMTPLVPRASQRGLSHAKIPKYTKMSKCQNAKMPKCQNAKMPKCCQNATKMPKCQNAAKMLPKCQNAKMPKCQNAKIQKCKNTTKM